VDEESRNEDAKQRERQDAVLFDLFANRESCGLGFFELDCGRHVVVVSYKNGK